MRRGLSRAEVFDVCVVWVGTWAVLEESEERFV